VFENIMCGTERRDPGRGGGGGWKRVAARARRGHLMNLKNIPFDNTN
jgi:hypothetical protein